MQQPNTFPIMGVRTMQQLEDNLGALEFTLGPEHLARLSHVSRFDLGFPHDFLGGTSYKTNKWLKAGGILV